MKKHTLQFLASFFVVCLLAIPFNSCNQTEVLPLKTELQETGSFILPTEHADLVTFGPMQFTRGTEEPTVFEVQMNEEDFECFVPPYTLFVVNGELDGKYRVTSALISFDGTVVFSQSDFGKKVEQLNQDVEITESSNIRVELRGQPGTFVHVYITGVKGDCCTPYGTFVDERDGQVYKCVTIGDQVWMAENLRATAYNDGKAIPLVTDNSAWVGLSTPAYCWYNNDQSQYAATYGALYKWYTVNTGKLCPTGWHVPSDVEWTALTDYLGGASVAGGALKEEGTAHWRSPNTGATNSSGFTAVPGGLRNGYSGTFFSMGYFGYWWSSTAYGDDGAWCWGLGYDRAGVGRYGSFERHGFSVRCLRD